ncbi:arginine decarboxylase [soil metagenome]
MDQTRAPFFARMQEFAASDAVMFSTPGHKRGAGLDETVREMFGAALGVDVPHGGGVDTPHFSRGLLRQAERLAAEAHGGDDARFLVNGSTTGNLAMLLATCNPGDEIIISRMLHKSLLAGLVFSGARPVYLKPVIDEQHNLPLDTRPESVAEALRNHPDAKAVVLVSPSYVGVTSDLERIAEICHAAGVPLLVDEAWGPHLHFHSGLPQSAMAAGADASVSSTHKMLGALTQGSTLVMRRGLLDIERMHTVVDMVQTTSPSVLIFGSLDASRRQMALEGERLLGRAIELARQVRDAVAEIDGLSAVGPDLLAGRDGADFDVTRVMVDIHELGLTGYDAEEILREQHSVMVEMSDLMSVLLLITIGDDDHSISRLIAGLRDLPNHRRQAGTGVMPRSTGELLFSGEAVMTPREAFSATVEHVAPAAAVGRISAESITPYPPGIPIITPGERIRTEVIDYLRAGIEAGMYISGLSDETFSTLRVVAADRPIAHGNTPSLPTGHQPC